MHVAKQILQFFQIVAPARVLLRQKILYGVAEVLDANSKFMPADRRPCTQSASVQIIGLRPLFQRQMHVNEAARSHPACALRLNFTPLAPLSPIELIEIFASELFEASFARFDVIEQLDGDRILDDILFLSRPPA